MVQQRQVPIDLRQVQAIQGAQGPKLKPVEKWRRMVPVRAGSKIRTRFGPTSARVSRVVTIDECGSYPVVHAPCVLPAKPDVDQAETIAAAVAEGLRRAPLLATTPAPWVAPDFRSQRFPQTTVVVLNTFGNTDVRTVQAQRALASYIGTTNFTVATANLTAGTPGSVLSFRAPDAYHADELVVACQDLQLLYLTRWTVTVNGRIVSGPFALIGGRAPLNLNARRDDAISVNAILATGDAFAVGAEILLNGWIFPALKTTDGTYDRQLRSSPGWQREEKFR